MAWDVPLKLGGPVLRWELLRASRHWWARVIRYGCLGWILINFLALTSDLPTDKHIPQAMKQKLGAQSSAADQQRAQAAGRVNFANYAVATLLEQQLLLLVLVAPAVAATALGREKERDTFAAVLCTEMTAREIVLGKFLGRLALMLTALVGGLPLFIMLAVLGDFNLTAVALAIIQLIVMTAALTAACMLVAVWARQARDALLTCYAIVILGFVAANSVAAGLQLPDWINPIAVLTRLCSRGLPEWWLLAAHFAFWLAIGAGCLMLAAGRLRSSCLRQLEARAPSWRWNSRPAVGSDPVRWRERFVIGLAPVPWLRRVPRWLGVIGVASFFAVIAAFGLESAAGNSFFDVLLHGDFNAARQLLESARVDDISDYITLMGVLMAIAAPVVVAIRSAGCISEERRRKTWEDLCLTPLTVDRIVWGKLWGIVLAAVPYLVACTLPMIALGAIGGLTQAVNAVLWFVAAVVLCNGVVVLIAPLLVSAADPWFEPPPPPRRRDRLDYSRPTSLPEKSS